MTVNLQAAYYEQQIGEKAVAEDEAAFEEQTQPVVKISKALVFKIRVLIAQHQGGKICV